MNARQAYEGEALSTFARIAGGVRRGPGLSDQDRENEWRAQRLLQAAYAQFVSIAQDAAALSDIRKDVIADMLKDLSEAMPDFVAWGEAISNARRGF